ncbi:MAG: pyruvate, phosphate dikinase [Deltaproteobacteria bacterium]|nr:pyruvate, phosphate dikinase [Deltaproteobacteria bacterium]
MANKYVYTFGGGKAEGKAQMKNLLGGKGANLAEMSNLGIPVPAGFTISTEVCTYFYDHKRQYPPELTQQIDDAMAKVEKVMGRKFNDLEHPLLVSVRSGARVSMPGMMDTVLNLGINDEIVKVIEKDNPRAAWDCYRRFIQMYGDVVLDIRPRTKSEVDPFESVIEKIKKRRGVTFDVELELDDLKELVSEFKKLVKQRTKKPFPQNPRDQLWGAIGAVIESWHNERAKVYRRINKIPEEWGTAVNVQAMVFGNFGDDCATGVGFSRNPSNGDKNLYGEYLINAQGEDVVAGIRTPLDFADLQKNNPKIYKELETIVRKLEKHYKDMQDVEFTIEHGRLWMLQTRNGKRTGFATCRIAVDMVKEKLVTEKDALTRLIPDANALDQLLKPVFDPASIEHAKKEGRHLASGLAAGPGAACGRVVFHADDAAAMAAKGNHVILVRHETSPEDIGGMEVADGILTALGGQTSHAALVARQMGKVCVAGCSDLSVNYGTKTAIFKGRKVRQGEYISLNGFLGDVYEGEIKVMPSEVKQGLFGTAAQRKGASQSKTFQAYTQLMKWADKYRTMNVRANADQPDQAELAVAYGAEGIGLCRTEHMFFGGDRIKAVQEMILANDKEGREKALAKLLPMQRSDFFGILKAMGSRPVTIRLLDPPLHEFLPTNHKEIVELSKDIGQPAKTLKAKLQSLKEFNPMLGHRGCRLGVVFPEIYLMQARAIIEAALDVQKKHKIKVKPEIMIPLVGHWKELNFLRGEIEKLIDEIKDAKKLKIQIGTMIELPRAAVTADEIAAVADFFSFGTNDLTQTTFGLSRDDAGKFLPHYVQNGILPEDPFVSIDSNGVGQLVRMGTEKGRSVNDKLKVGICGEHGGDPASIHFCQTVGLNYVSCSPPRLSVARLAAAQAALIAEAAK